MYKRQGQGGSVVLDATDQIRISGAETIVSSASHSPGAAGNIQLQAANLLLQQGATIQSTSGYNHPRYSRDVPKTGSAGNIQIDLSDTLRMSGASQLNTSTAGSGNAGNIIIGKQTRPVALWMESGARIRSGSESTAVDAGQAGQLKIFTNETIELHGNSALTTVSENAGGGGVHIETRDLLRLQDSTITTSVNGGEGRGGDIFVDPVFIILENSRIQANAHGGDGGNITLVADYLLQSGPSVIEASSALSTSGEVEVQAVDIDAGALQAATEIDPLDVAQWQPVPCSQRRGGISRLIMAGYDAHPTPVDDVLSSLSVWTQMPLGSWGQHAAQQPVKPSTAASQPFAFRQAPLAMLQGYSLAAPGTLAGTCDYL